MLILKIKKTKDNAKLPMRAHPDDAGLDLFAADVTVEGNNLVCNTGVAVEIPEDYVGLVFPRSSIANRNLLLSNSVGVIDPGYRGSILVKFKDTRNNDTQANVHYEPGDKVAQLIIVKNERIILNEVESLSESQRGENGYGSTG